MQSSINDVVGLGDVFWKDMTLASDGLLFTECQVIHCNESPL